MSKSERKSAIKQLFKRFQQDVIEILEDAEQSKRKRRTPEEIAADAAKPKRPTSEKQKRWNAFVSQVHAEMKEEDPKAKRTDAMKRAKELKEQGKYPEDVPDDDSDSESDSEPVAPPKKVTAAKAAPSKEEKKPAEKKTKEKTKEEKKAKPAPPPESDSDSDSDSDDDVPPPPKTAKAVAASTKPSPAPKKTPPPPPKKSPAPAADSDSEDDDDGESLKKVQVGNKTVWMSSLGECWDVSALGGRGKWLGLFDEKSKKIKPAPEPEVE
jgi:hypothetical protein